MIESELIAKVAERTKIRHREAALLVESIFGAMREAILNGERIELRGFGSFINREYSSYKAEIPRPVCPSRFRLEESLSSKSARNSGK